MEFLVHAGKAIWGYLGASFPKLRWGASDLSLNQLQ
jgi:hypothetical protein